MLIAILECDKGVDGLAHEFIVNSIHGSFGDSMMVDGRSLNLCSENMVAGDAGYVVDPVADLVVALVVTSNAVASEAAALVHVPLLSTKDSVGYAWP